MTKNLFIFILMLPFAALAQVLVTGSVINQADTRPVPNASVFLNNAIVGSKTADNGTFNLQNVKPGQYDLVVSIIGFDLYKQTIIVGNDNLRLPVISLSPKIIALNAVIIKAGRYDPDREKYYEKFKKEFLGSTELAKECKIINPELLDFYFNADSNTLKASSVDFLEIENRGLGYKIKYLLNDFLLDNSSFDTKILNYNGYVLFEKLKGTPSQEKEWQKRRSEAYEGSRMHFLRSAIGDKIEEEGFRVLRLPAKSNYVPDSVFYIDTKLSKNIRHNDSVITGPNKYGLYNLFNKGDMLYISYNKYHHFNNSSYTKLGQQGNSIVSFNSPNVLFDNNGAIIDPHSLTYDGAWARTGVAGLLPVDYEDGQQNNSITAGIQITSIVNKLRAFADTQKTESAYLQFDKPYYAAGDTIYFKAYVIQGGQRMLSQLSGVLHVDLINSGNKINQSIRLPLTNGLAWGDLALPDTLKEGNYRVRAYTNPMLNEANTAYFEQNVIIGATGVKKFSESGSFHKEAVALKPVTNKTEVQFLPEGGSFITGNYCKVAFKAIAANGLAADINGTVTDNEGTEICTFASTHLGMGAFNMVPEPGKTYKANITYANGEKGTVELPIASNSGYTINLNNTDPDNIRLRITAGSGSPADKLSLVAQAAGVVYYVADSGPFNKFFTAVIPKRKFPSGILQFTVFNDAGEPLNERLVFVDNNDRLKLDVSANSKVYAARQKVRINLEAKDFQRNPSVGSFSVSVTDETKVPVNELNENSILADLLLTSELKGNVEQPNYYFTNANEKTQSDLDVLMLTQGYRNFTWKKVLSNKPNAVFYQPETGLKIAGQITEKGKPVAGGKVTLFTNAGGSFLRDTLTDTTGNFAFRNLSFSDSTKFVLQAKLNKGQDDAGIKLESASPPAVLASNFVVRNSLADTGNALTPYLQNQKEFYQEQAKLGINKHPLQLKEVVIRDKKSFLKHSNNLNGPGHADQVITADELKDLAGVTLSFRLKAKLFGDVDFINGIPHSMHSRSDKSPMQVVIDGNYVDYTEYDHLDPDRVQSVEVLTSPNYGTVYGTKGSAGVLVITTKRGEDYKNENEHNGVNKPPVFLKEVIVKGKKDAIIPHSENLNGSGNADQVLTEKELEKMNCGRIVECLSGVLTGVRFTSLGAKSSHTTLRDYMAIIIDGNYSDIETFYSLNTADLEGIEVILGTHYGAIYGSRASGGALIVTTKRAKPINNYYRYAPGVTTFAAEGYYKAREFYSPRYDNPLVNKNTKDLRSTIFWKPDVVTDKDGKASFEYFNADGKGTFRVVIEGVDNDGNLGRQVYRYEVE